MMTSAYTDENEDLGGFFAILMSIDPMIALLGFFKVHCYCRCHDHAGGEKTLTLTEDDNDKSGTTAVLATNFRCLFPCVIPRNQAEYRLQSAQCWFWAKHLIPIGIMLSFIGLGGIVFGNDGGHSDGSANNIGTVVGCMHAIGFLAIILGVWGFCVILLL